MTADVAPARTPVQTRLVRNPLFWGVVVGAAQAASPLGFGRLDAATVYALGLSFIPAVYIGLAVADGRPRVVVVESVVAAAFVLVAVAAVTGTSWLLVLGFVGHGLKDLWQHRTHFVTGTRWWPPFCMIVDFVVAAVLVVLIVAGVHLHV